jgi:hypothetical protein
VLNSYYPPQIVSDGVVAIAAGAQHSLFVKSDGSLWAMGLNDDGELGDGFGDALASIPEQVFPSPQPLLTGIKLLSKTNLQFHATCRFGGKYDLRATTNLALPLTQWTSVSTNSIEVRGENNFITTLTNVVSSSGSWKFYILQSQ